jgi:hypothetical protein
VSEQIKFHLDENVSSAIADGLRRRGINATTTTEVGLIGASDETQPKCLGGYCSCKSNAA